MIDHKWWQLASTFFREFFGKEIQPQPPTKSIESSSPSSHVLLPRDVAIRLEPLWQSTSGPKGHHHTSLAHHQLMQLILLGAVHPWQGFLGFPYHSYIASFSIWIFRQRLCIASFKELWISTWNGWSQQQYFDALGPKKMSSPQRKRHTEENI